jgi:threonine synthase
MSPSSGAAATHQRCADCGTVYAETDARTRCTCGGLLDIVHPLQELTSELRDRWTTRARAARLRSASGVWRYLELVMPSAGDRIVSHPEGNTPLLERSAIARYAGAERMLLKHEGLNPTGSFKDRGMTVGMTQALRIGARAVACASTGNTSASMAAYAAQAGIPAFVFVPAGQVSTGKLAQALAYGARTLIVRGDFDDCLRLVQDASDALGVYMLNSINPWRVEGQKTIVLELLQQIDWQPPDWIVLPAGKLGNTASFGKALREAWALGLISRLPRLAAVQASGASPFASSFRDEFTVRHRSRAETVATAIRIGDPASYDRAVDAIRLTNGVVTDVSDDAILDAKAVVDARGVGCEPASAAAVAGTRRLVAEGVIDAGEQVVVVLTGHVLKDPATLLHYHQEVDPPPPGANRPLEIDATLRAVEAALRQQGLGA